MPVLKFVSTEIDNPQIYADFIQSRDVALIHFWASWNGYDYEMKPRLNELEAQYKDAIAFGSVDVDVKQMWNICAAVGMKNVPALAYYKSGEYVETVIGLVTKEAVAAKLSKLLER